VRAGALDEAAQRGVGLQQVALADHLVERGRAHARGERLLGRGHRRAPARAAVAGLEELLHAAILAARGAPRAVRRGYARRVPEGEELERRTTELLQRLIRFNTVNPPGNEQEAQEFLRGLLGDAGFQVELLADVEGRPNLIARLASEPRSDGPALTYLAHVDTVYADPADWSVDPWWAR